MEFTFGSHQSTPFIFSREIDSRFSTPSLKRHLQDPEPNGPAPKKRRLRLALTSSPLSLPYSTPRTTSLPDRMTSNRSKLGAIGGTCRPSPWRPSPPSYSPSSGTSSLLRKAAILNRVQQRIDVACERNPNLRWEKERLQERELLLREGLEMRRMAALKDGLSPVNSTRPVVGNAAPLHLDPDLRPVAASSLDCNDCERRAVADSNVRSPTWCCKDGHPTPPASTCTVGLSNYDALDSEEQEKEEGGAATRQTNSNGVDDDDDTNTDTNDVPVDEGIRDIFDFLTPPASHQTYLSFPDYSDDIDDSGPGPGRANDDSPGPGPEKEDEEQPAAAAAAAAAPVDTAPLKQPCSFWGCQTAVWIPPRRLTGNDAALQYILRQPRHHRHRHRHYAMSAFVAVPPAL